MGCHATPASADSSSAPVSGRRNGFDCQGLGPYPFRTGLTLLRAIVEQVRNGRQRSSSANGFVSKTRSWVPHKMPSRSRRGPLDK